MTAEVSLLMLTAFSVGFIHTILGPDHYIPFVAMARTNQWSPRRTLFITSLCGLGHIIGSIVIGGIGLVLGVMVFQLEAIESFRGDVAAWLLIGFGLAYLTWGIVSAIRDIPHTHMHSHADGTIHSHLHKHDIEHRHLHSAAQLNEARQIHTQSGDSKTSATKAAGVTPWLLFLIFVFGPCEVLIPLLMYPAAEANFLAIVGVVAAFSIATITTMIVSVMLMTYGLSFLRAPQLHRYNHALAGLAVLLCGLLMKLGL